MSDQLKELTLDLKALPGSGLWTGDAALNMSYIKATSILGGLRFWTEALLRSLGQDVCHDQGRCTFSKKEGKACACCSIFGCTGLSRQFALMAESPEVTGLEEKVRLSQRQHDGETPYYLFKSGHTDAWKLSLVSRRPEYLGRDEKGTAMFGKVGLPPAVIAALALMLKFGTFGARDQYNCGLMEAVSGKKELFEAARAAIDALPSGSVADTAFPDLRDFFFFKGKACLNETAPNHHNTLCALLRHDIRNVVRAEAPKHPSCREDRKGDRAYKDEFQAFRHWFCGFMPKKGKKPPVQGTHINIGVLTDGRFYGWGWYPKGHEKYGKAREGVLKAIKAFVEGAPHPAVAEAMRDKEGYSVSHGEWLDLRDRAGDWKAALSSLLNDDCGWR